MTSIPHIYVAVVDDDESLCRSVGRLLRASGVEAVTYDSAEAFLDDTKRPRFDCLLLDIHLGGMSGIELNRKLSASGSTTPVVYITAHHEPEIREQALGTSCEGFLRKDTPADVLLEAIRKAVFQENGSQRPIAQT